MIKGTLVQHKKVTSFLGKVEGPDPDDKKRVMVKPLSNSEEKPFSYAIENLNILG